MAPQLGTFAQGSTLLHFARNGNFGPDGQDLMVVERGEGAYIFDTHGNRYVDGLVSALALSGAAPTWLVGLLLMVALPVALAASVLRTARRASRNESSA